MFLDMLFSQTTYLGNKTNVYMAYILCKNKNDLFTNQIILSF